MSLEDQLVIAQNACALLWACLLLVSMLALDRKKEKPPNDGDRHGGNRRK